MRVWETGETEPKTQRPESEFLKSEVDIFSLFEKGNKQPASSPVLRTPTLISESLDRSPSSPRPSLKDAVPEDQDVSFYPAECPSLSAFGGLMDLQSASLMRSLFIPK